MIYFRKGESNLFHLHPYYEKIFYEKRQMTVKYFTQFCNFWHRSFATCLFFHWDQSFSFILIINEIEVIIWHKSPATMVPDVRDWSSLTNIFTNEIRSGLKNIQTVYKRNKLGIISYAKLWINFGFVLGVFKYYVIKTGRGEGSDQKCLGEPS